MRGLKTAIGAFVAFAGLLAAPGCPTETSFVCGDDSQCVGADQGMCQPNGFCSFPDDECPTGQRYGKQAPSTLAGQCVPVMGAGTGSGGQDDDGSGGGAADGTSGGSDDAADDGSDTGPAVEPQCGDGVAEGEEACDGADLGDATCLSEGFAGGALQCGSDCTLDTTNCDLCGNGAIDTGEECDGENLGGVSTCADVGLGEDDEPLACSRECVLDYGSCSSCGNGIVMPPEACEAGDLAGETCQSQGFDAGQLACGRGCIFDTTGCS
ncbi:MAG: hypothetical protein AAF721_08920 [Myxococcota bacterium]